MHYFIDKLINAKLPTSFLFFLFFFFPFLNQSGSLFSFFVHEFKQYVVNYLSNSFSTYIHICEIYHAPIPYISLKAWKLMFWLLSCWLRREILVLIIHPEGYFDLFYTSSSNITVHRRVNSKLAYDFRSKVMLFFIMLCSGFNLCHF